MAGGDAAVDEAGDQRELRPMVATQLVDLAALIRDIAGGEGVGDAVGDVVAKNLLFGLVEGGTDGGDIALSKSPLGGLRVAVPVPA